MSETPLRSDADVITDSHQRPVEFTELYRRHAATVFRYVASRLGVEAAEDVRSEVFLTAFECRARYDGSVPSALPWLLGIATRLIRKQRREEAVRWRAITTVGALGGEGSPRAVQDPAFETDRRLDAARAVAGVDPAIRNLSRRDRDVLTLAAWTDLDAPGIAQVLGIPPGTVRSRLHRVRKILRAHVTDPHTTGMERNDE